MRPIIMLMALLAITGCDDMRPQRTAKKAVPASVPTELPPQRFAKIQPYAVPEKPLLPGYDQYTPYLRKVAELHSRSSRCKAVTSVDISNLSTPDDPVFYVVCEDKTGVHYTTQYSLFAINHQLVRGN